jgi:hypothetical protein
MTPRALTVGTLLAAYTTLPLPVFAGCEAQSGPKTAALVELYTSEGCSSCPPADRQLSRLQQVIDPAATVILLSLHVDYWDYIGWKDPYAQSDFAKRQGWLAHFNAQGFVYTPQFFVGGPELRSWPAEFREEVQRLNAQPAEAQIRINASVGANDAIIVTADATTYATGDRAELYLAVTENGLVSKVTRGENGGVTLAHDHVVRVWIGPIPLDRGEARVQREISLPVSWNRAQLELVGFVEDARSGRVLQAVGVQQCFRS